MFAPGFHPRCRNRPNLGIAINLSPRRAEHLAGACRRQDQEFKSHCGHGFPFAQRGDKFRHGIEGYGGEVAARELLAFWQELVEVPPPSGRVRLIAAMCPLARAASSTVSIRPRRREAVSGFACQIDCKTPSTASVSTSSTGRARKGLAYS